jgi:hypothetical protein
MDDKLAELVDRLKKAHQERLVSVVLYGSAAANDQHEKYSDLNVLCVLTGVTLKDLSNCEPALKWWREQGNPSPLLMSQHEVETSSDCFPIEYHDMQEQRRVLFGKDVIAGLAIDRSFYRAQVEHELRAKLLRLRQKGAGLLSDENGLLRLMLDSVSTFLVLARHALLLSGVEADWKKREIVDRLSEIGVDPVPFDKLLNVREQKQKASELEAGSLFEPYLLQIEALVSYVDRLEK